MIRPAWWLGALLALSYVGMTSAAAGPTGIPAATVRDTPPTSAGEPPAWKPSLPPWEPSLPSFAVPSRSPRQVQTASYPRPVALTDSGIPSVALNAYRSAAALMARSAPSCELHWSLLAAIGRVESDHGRYGSSAIAPGGDVTPAILGPQLNGAGVALITDTDGGRLDSDTTFDRAVGPMQFLPSTWDAVAADGNDDGVADPGNIYDATLAAGRYLCAGSVNLDDPAQLRAAVYRYNHSWPYVDLVLALAAAYRSGGEPSGPVVAAGQPPKPIKGNLPPATTGRPPAAGSAAGSDPPLASSRTPPGSDTPPADSPPPPPSDPSPSGSPDQPGTPPTPPPPSPSPTSPSPTGPGEPSSDPTAPSEPPTDPSPTDPPDQPSTPPTPTPPSPSPPSPSPTPSPTLKPPTVAALSPAAGPVGSAETEVAIEGSGLRKASASFGGARAETLSSSHGRLVVAAPARDQAGPVEVVVVRDGMSSESASFTYLPVVSSVDPEKAPPGATLTVAGAGFTENSTVTLTPAEASEDDDNEPIAPEVTYDTDNGALLVTLPDDLRPGPYLLAVTTDDATGAPVRIDVA